MYISHKSNVLQSVQDTEWNCRRMSKGLSKPEYWTWLDTITTVDAETEMETITYPSEDFTIVECRDELVDARIQELGDYVSSSGVYNINFSDSKEYFVMAPDMDGNSVKIIESEEKDEDPDSDTFGDVIKTNYKMSHFEGDDTTRDARIIVEKWARVRNHRNVLIAETDYLALSDTTLSADMTTYRQDLRDVPTQSDPDDISWPTKP